VDDGIEIMPMIHADDGAWNAVLADLVRRCADIQPDELGDAANASCAALGIDLTLYLVDHEQRRLWPVPKSGKPVPAPLSLEGTIAGRTFTSVTTHLSVGPAGRRLWVPMVNGAERVGLAEFHAGRAAPDPEHVRRNAELVAGLLAQLISAKLPYGDLLHRIRRTHTMHPSGELLLSMLPPLTFGCRRVTITAVLEPCYGVGGDAYDYAVDGSVAYFMILDSMGRGMQAALTSAAVLAATRAARRAGDGLDDMASAADAVVAEQFSQMRYATAVLCELDTVRGLLRYVNAGHPPPSLIRDGRAVRAWGGGRRLPLGLNDADVVVGEEQLHPGDRILLFTDGVTDARDRVEPGSGVRWLTDAARRSAAAGSAAPEALRRLSHAVMGSGGNRRLDDATLMLVEWHPADRTPDQAPERRRAGPASSGCEP
jgi:sigma-B regulation protein RsbU (phosphoserine phosphatase)